MATLSNTYGITLVVGTSSTEYGGASSNQFFGGSSDRIAMLRFDPPSALGANQVISDADITAWFKADTTASADYIWIGLITSAWNSTTTNYATLYSYLTTTADTAYLSVTTTAQQMALAINSILQVWASDPSAYSGLYFRRQGGLSMTRIGTGAVINTTVQTTTACTTPAYTSLSKTAVDPGEAITYSWSNASGGTLNAITGYIVEYQSSDDGGSSWSAWAVHETVVTTNTYGSSIVYGGAFGVIVRVRVKTTGAAGASYYSAPSDYKTYTSNSAQAGTPPSNVSLSASMAAPGGTVSLSWSGASPGNLNPITGYYIARSTNGGAYDEDWQTDTASPYNVTAHATYGNYYSYKLITRGQYADSAMSSAYATLTTYTPTDCGAPKTASLNKTVAETAPTLTYSGASAGTINGITGYEIQYAESSNNSTWGAWTALKTVANTGTSGTTTVNLSSTRGHYRKYQIRTQGSAGASYYSGWKATASVRYNSAPTAPTVFTASPAVYVSGTIALAYSGATDADNNISTYNVQYATSANGTTWGSWVSLSNGATSHTPTLSPGHYIKYQVRAVDAFSVTSGWKASNICGKNTAPAAPAITYPQNSKTIYNSRPRFLVTMGADPESHTMTLAASGFTLSRSSGLVGGSKIIARRTSAASAGAVSISATATDQYAESSSAAARSTTYAVPSFTDATITGGTTRVKAAHMTELRTMVNNVRKYYGLPEFLAAGTNYIPTIDGDNIDWTTWGPGTTLARWDATHIYYPASTTITRGIISPEFMINGRSGDVYTLSIETAARSGIANGTQITYIYLMDPIGGNASLMRDGEIILAGSVVKRSLRVTLPRDLNNPVKLLIGTQYSQVTADGDVIIGKVKLEKGITATDWTEAPTGSYSSWAEAITAGVTKSRGWKAHVIELQQAISDVVTLVNGWDTFSSVNRISSFAWITPGVKPSAAVINQIRQVITWL